MLERFKKRQLNTSTVSKDQDSEEGKKKSSSATVVEMTDQIKKLQEQLRTKQAEVGRWENVNNKLMAKLRAKG